MSNNKMNACYISYEFYNVCEYVYNHKWEFSFIIFPFYLPIIFLILLACLYPSEMIALEERLCLVSLSDHLSGVSASVGVCGETDIHEALGLSHSVRAGWCVKCQVMCAEWQLLTHPLYNDGTLTSVTLKVISFLSSCSPSHLHLSSSLFYWIWHSNQENILKCTIQINIILILKYS